MTKYRFTQSVMIARKAFKLGIQDVPDEIEAHPDFLHYVQVGYVHAVTPEEIAPELPKPVASRSEELAKKLSAKYKPAPVQEPVRLNVQEVMGITEGQADQAPELESETQQQRGARTRKANAEKPKKDE